MLMQWAAQTKACKGRAKSCLSDTTEVSDMAILQHNMMLPTQHVVATRVGYAQLGGSIHSNVTFLGQ